jgi:hypothetical protein
MSLRPAWSFPILQREERQQFTSCEVGRVLALQNCLGDLGLLKPASD